MTIIAKIISSIGLFMLYGLISGAILGVNQKGPSLIGMFLSIGLIAGEVAIWRSKTKKNISEHKLNKRDNDGV
jgi:hypothetical protein